MINDGTELYKIVYFDYSACFVLCMVLLSTVMRKMTKGQLNKNFIMLVVTAIAASVFDCFAVRHDNMLYANLDIRMLEHTGYLFFHVLTTPLFCLYATGLTDTVHIIRRRPILLYGIGVPYLMVTGALFVNLFNHKMFYFDETLHYVRGEWFWLLYFSAVFYVAYLIYFLIRFRNSVGTERWASLVVLLICMLAAIALQYFFPRYPVEMFATAVGLLFISVMVQRPEDILDVESGAKSRNAFSDDMKRSFENDKVFDIVILRISNLRSFGDLIGFDERMGLLKKTLERIESISQQKGIPSEVYYLRGGIFAITFDDRFKSLTEEFDAAVYEEVQKPITVSNMQINLIAHTCIIHCPEDISGRDELSSFINKAIPFQTGRSTAADVLASGRYNMIMDMDSIISAALAENRLEVYYQPIYSIKEKRFASAEALIRLKDEKYGFVPPDIFIPEAEKNGMIHKIGQFVFESVCSFMASDEFSSLGVDYIEVNLSVAECMSDSLADEIIGTLEKYGLSHDRINLEITETFAEQTQSVMEENIRKLTEAGFSFSLDDFGTGYSNMQSIALLPLSMTKLDKTLTAIENNDKMRLVVEHSIDLIKALDMKIVVEGVETKETLERFSQLGCEYIQGYYFSKPLPKSEFVKFITGHKTA